MCDNILLHIFYSVLLLLLKFHTFQYLFLWSLTDVRRWKKHLFKNIFLTVLPAFGLQKHAALFTLSAKISIHRVFDFENSQAANVFDFYVKYRTGTLTVQLPERCLRSLAVRIIQHLVACRRTFLNLQKSIHFFFILLHKTCCGLEATLDQIKCVSPALCFFERINRVTPNSIIEA